MAFEANSARQAIGERVANRTSGGVLLFRRWMGAWLDFMAMAALLFAPIFMGGRTDAVRPAFALVGVALVVLYFPVTEGLSGRSLGKLVTGTVVVNAAGDPPGLGRAAIRTLLRLVEVNPFLLGGLPAGVVSLCNDGHQRLGDLLARTYVVPSKELRAALAGIESGPVDPAIVEVFS